MSKRSEIAALKAYPNVEQPVWDESYPKTLFVRHTERNSFVKGYEQAEKDYIELAQLWVDSGYVNIMSFKQFLKCHETQSNK